MAKIAPKHHLTRDVYDLACERVAKCFKKFDTPVVWFSGGKDSTAVLHVAMDVAVALNKPAPHVAFFDEEVIPPETVEYCDRVRRTQRVRFHWLCLPIKHRNACSSKSPWWYPYDPDCPELWARPIPEWAKVEADYPLFQREPHDKTTGMIFPPNYGTVVSIMGVRTQESLNRYQAIAYGKTGHDAFMAADHWRHVRRAYPIYDWAHDDVWYAPEKFGWDYNRAYDIMQKAGIPIHNQRCAPPYGEQPLERLWTYKSCWPELWDKMAYRVPGAATAGRYGNTAIYGHGGADTAMKPPSLSWREFINRKIEEFPEKDRAKCAKGIQRLLDDHAMYTKDPLPDSEPHPASGLCWMAVAKLAIRGDIKGRKVIGLRAQARMIRERHADGKPTR